MSVQDFPSSLRARITARPSATASAWPTTELIIEIEKDYTRLRRGGRSSAAASRSATGRASARSTSR